MELCLFSPRIREFLPSSERVHPTLGSVKKSECMAQIYWSCVYWNKYINESTHTCHTISLSLSLALSLSRSLYLALSGSLPPSFYPGGQQRLVFHMSPIFPWQPHSRFNEANPCTTRGRKDGCSHSWSGDMQLFARGSERPKNHSSPRKREPAVYSCTLYLSLSLS